MKRIVFFSIIVYLLVCDAIWPLYVILIAGIIYFFLQWNHRKKEWLNAMHELAHSQDQLRYLSYHDEVTGLTNRRWLEENLSLQPDRPFAMFLIALERLNHINVLFGKSVGENVLQEVSEILEKQLDGGGTISRVGDHFVVSLPYVEESEVSRAACQLVEKLSQPLNLSHHHLEMKASIGISLFPKHGGSVRKLYEHAEIALNYAIEKGKNHVMIFQPEWKKEIQERRMIENDLRNAIIEGQIMVVFQPWIDARNGALIGVEALARWNHPRLGVVSPNRFIPIAEESGMMHELGKYMMEQACRQMMGWSFARDIPLVLSLNLSTVQLHHPGIVEDLRTIIEECRVPSSKIVVEVTENIGMGDMKSGIGKLQQLKELGLTIALDDFGSGYSSLSYVKQLPIDCIKIDKQFVEGLGRKSKESAIVKSIISLAHNLRLLVLAEGVETEQQAELLREYGCDLLQGYYFSKPISGQALEGWYASYWKTLHVVNR